MVVDVLAFCLLPTTPFLFRREELMLYLPVMIWIAVIVDGEWIRDGGTRHRFLLR